jgi:hypothetical protein
MRVRFSDGVSLLFHAPCFTAWFTETQRPTRSRSSRDPPPPCEPDPVLTRLLAARGARHSMA